MKRIITSLAVTGALVGGGLAIATSASATDPFAHQATVDGDRVEVSVDGEAALAGEQVSVLILDGDADPADPAASDVRYANQLVLDADGDTTLRVLLPTTELGDYVIALNTSGDTERYVALLDGSELPGDGPGRPGPPKNPGPPENPGRPDTPGRPGHVTRP